MDLRINYFSGFKSCLLAILVTLGSGPRPSTHLLASSPPGGRVLARGAAMHGTNGLAFDREGRLYVASVFGVEIVIMDPATGSILDHYRSDSGVQGPDDLTFGPDGSLYWTDLFAGEVGRRSP